MLLAVFPLTAVGLDVSIRKCNHTGKYFFSFAGFNSNKVLCCCTSENLLGKNISFAKNICSVISVTANKTIAVYDNYYTRDKQKLPLCCIKKNITKKETCCNSNTNNNLNNIALACSNELKNSNNCPVENSYSSKCCNTTKLSISINATSYTAEKNFKIIDYQKIFPISYFDGKFQSILIIKSKLNIIEYPLKEPINSIISFIRLTSNSIDDSDILPENCFC